MIRLGFVCTTEQIKLPSRVVTSLLFDESGFRSMQGA